MEFRTNADLFFYLADEDGNALALGGDALGVHKNYFLASGLRTDVGSWQLHLKSLVMLGRNRHCSVQMFYLFIY